MGQICRVLARLLSEDGTPVPRGVAVDLMDEDPLMDDFMGKTDVGQDGRVEVVFDLAAAISMDTPFETEPDLYFRVRNGNMTIARTRTHPNVVFLDQLAGPNPPEQPVVDLGDVVLK